MSADLMEQRADLLAEISEREDSIRDHEIEIESHEEGARAHRGWRDGEVERRDSAQVKLKNIDFLIVRRSPFEPDEARRILDS